MTVLMVLFLGIVGSSSLAVYSLALFTGSAMEARDCNIVNQRKALGSMRLGCLS